MLIGIGSLCMKHNINIQKAIAVKDSIYYLQTNLIERKELNTPLFRCKLTVIASKKL